MLDWITCVNTFQNIVKLGSFSKTAKQLHTTPSAISKRINWLEDTLGVPLFRRSTRQITLTEAGEALYSRSIPLLNEWKEIKREVSSQHHEPNGVLQLGVPIGFGSSYIVDMLPSFIERYPSVSVNLKLTNCVSNLSNQQIDIYITNNLNAQNTDNFHEEPIIELHNQVYASPIYIEKNGKPETIKELEQHNCIIVNCDSAGQTWQFDKDDTEITVSGSLATNNTTAAINAAVAGLGIISMCPIIINKEIEDGKLISLFPGEEIRRRTVKAYYPKQKFIPKKTTAFLEHLKEYFDNCCHEKRQFN